MSFPLYQGALLSRHLYTLDPTVTRRNVPRRRERSCLSDIHKTINAKMVALQTVLAYVRTWHHADASGRILGKFSARIANVLMGKNKPVFDPGGRV
jgi:hypothetical protein